MDTPFTRAIDRGDVDAARAFLEGLSVQCVEYERGTLEGAFVTRQPATLDVIERAARSWEAFDRLCEPSDDDWDDKIASFLDVTGLVDWGVDHLFVHGHSQQCRRIKAFSSEPWVLFAAGWTDQDTITRCARARELGL